ncbi:MAG: pantoate--beta-alanine ligase [Acidobacteriota bacterium]|nr:pantoate--beta-alanine ligase [Acidobacteriota bacterium]
MQRVHTVAAMQQLCRELRERHQSIHLVPTMGALHAGHLSLVRRARQDGGCVIVTIFVNPLQFGPSEDFSRYPRTLEADCALLEQEDVTAVFVPEVAEMYPPGACTTLTVAGLSDRLDGASRPGHFTGVATVVAKLFHAVPADRAYFGQKDAAQLAVIRRMVRDLNFGIAIVGCPIVRDPDGLALSSRNAYLSPQERTQALALQRCLLAMQAALASGIRDTETLLATGHAVLAAEPAVRLDYLAVVDADELLPVPIAVPGTLVAIAAWVGTTRLIDNLLVQA